MTKLIVGSTPPETTSVGVGEAGAVVGIGVELGAKVGLIVEVGIGILVGAKVGIDVGEGLTRLADCEAEKAGKFESDWAKTVNDLVTVLRILVTGSVYFKVTVCCPGSKLVGAAHCHVPLEPTTKESVIVLEELTSI